MAGLFTHVWIANLVSKQLKKKKGIEFRGLDTNNYFFGAVAPDIRYINNSDRNLTHKPKKQSSIFNALKIKNVTSILTPFLAGYDTHLIVDQVWSNEKIDDIYPITKSVYEYYNIDVKNDLQKFGLYAVVDDYFQAESPLSFQILSSNYVRRGKDGGFLNSVGFTSAHIALYKKLVARYLREPGIDNFHLLSFTPSNLEEVIVRKIAEQVKGLTDILTEFKQVSIEKCMESLEQHL